MEEIKIVKSDELSMARLESKNSIAFGVLLAIFGMFAIMSPVFSGISTTFIVGALLFVTGIFETVFAFKQDSFGKGALKFIFGGLFNSDSIIVPAFASRNFDALLRLARRMSYARTKLSLEPIMDFRQKFYNVEISLKKAVQLASLTLYREKIAKFGKNKDSLEEINPTKVELLYLPFHLENYFYQDSVLNSVTLEKRMLED